MTSENVSSELGAEVAGVQVSLGLDVNDVDGDWIRRREVADAGCVVVRPGRVVAWRSLGEVEAATAAPRDVMTSVLARA